MSTIQQFIIENIKMGKLIFIVVPNNHSKTTNKKYKSVQDVSATLRFGHSLYLISMDEETECRSLYFSIDY